MIQKFLFNAFLFVFLFVRPVNAATNYYVSNSGSDSGSGTQSAPFKTIKYTLNKAIAGDHIFIMPGEYTENISLDSKKGTSLSPIYITGTSENRSSYPVLNGGDIGYNSTTENPILNISSSSWLVFERLKFVNSSKSTVLLRGSHYITFRRNIFDYHAQAILLKSKSSHILVENNEMYQSYSPSLTWTNLKASKWEGGAFVSFGGAGMNIIRGNYIHDSFNGVFLNKGLDTSSKFLDANVFIHNNRFENIMDDPYEPETYAFNQHFYKNTLVNTLYMASLAPSAVLGQLVGPVYIYNNYQLVNKDTSGEGVSLKRKNAMIKLELPTGLNYSNGVMVFNNTSDFSASGIYSYGIDVKNTNIFNFTFLNNIVKSNKNLYGATPTLLNNSILDYNLSQSPFGFTETHGTYSTLPNLASSASEDGRLLSTSQALGKSRSINISVGFQTPSIINSGDDLGAYKFGQNEFRNLPSPVYVTPPGGEDSSFPANTNWPPDITGGINPISTPKWQYSTLSNAITPTTPITTTMPTSTLPTTPVLTSTPKPIITSAIKLGDADGDGKTTEKDFTIWKQYNRTSGGGVSHGDFNLDGTTNGIDYVFWAKNYDL